MLHLPQAKKSSSKSKKANGAKDFRNRGPLNVLPKSDPDALLLSGMGEPTGSGLRTPFNCLGPNVQSFNNGEDYTSRRKNEFASRLYPTKQDFSMRKVWEQVYLVNLR